MSATLLEAPKPASLNEALSDFRKQDAVIADLASQYMPLKIAGLSDKKGYQAVHEARMVVRKHRVLVERTRKDLKEDILVAGRAVDAEAKRLTDLLEPIEAHLSKEESAIDAEKERIKKAAEEARKALVRQRVDALAALGAPVDPFAIADMTEEQFTEALSAANQEAERRAKAEAEWLRIEAEEKAQREEELARMRAERERLAEIERQQKAESDRLRAEQDRLTAIESEQKRQAELEAARKEAFERSRVETEQRIENQRRQEEANRIAEANRIQAESEAKAAKDKADAEAKEAERIQAEKDKPLRAKFIAIAEAVEAIAIPAGKSGLKVSAVLKQAGADVRTIAKGRLS